MSLESLTVYATYLNGVLTLLCGVWLLYLYARKELETLPILLWGVAFVFYGLEILVRIILGFFNLFIMLNIIMIILFILGLGLILQRPRLIHSITLIVMVAAFVLMFVGYGEFSHMIGLLYFYVTMTVGSVLIVNKYGPEVYPLLLGWTIILVSNIFLLFMPQNPITDINCSVAKVIFTLGARRLEFLMPRELRLRRYIEALKRRFGSR